MNQSKTFKSPSDTQKIPNALPPFFKNPYLQSDMSLGQRRLAHITDSKQQAQLSVTHANHRIFAKQNRRRSFDRSRQLGKNDAGHEGLEDETGQKLNTHNENNRRASVGWVSEIRVTVCKFS